MRRMLGSVLQMAAGTVFVVGLAACGGEQTSMEQYLIQQGCSVNSPDPRACDPADTKKTTICHVPPGNPANAHTICVGNAAVPAHLDHGDFLGTCSCAVDAGTDDTDAGSGSGSGDGGMDGGIVL